ncbi:lytic murein transglycosylase [Cognatiyoonia koreensis]|uniref:Lytic murein transglycosylase n=1 Tax=Cognatiyoonia koreensis TaxID=364200 RepID=A0A1I0P9T0_9RHOB|nr:lytic murein transglycosylase [Cognatiyoonia koreensis]SEW10855.1 lytic murein transglycosylase [Cognatiyoonia koreensis]
MRNFLFLLVVLPGLLSAQTRAEREADFETWLEIAVWPEAANAGVSRKTFDSALSRVRLNWDLPDLVPPAEQGQQRQTEFGAPSRYFEASVVGAATRIGREEAQRHAATLARIEAETGVPGRILLAIWGRESSYGRAAIPHDAFEVLATKAFAATRSSYFRSELIAALKIAESGRAPTPLRSSWAGALGQPQFMPSSYLAYARDGDGDGRADIWGSAPDTLASIAAYLENKGWQSSRDWGFEVALPASVSCTLEGPDQGRPIREWDAMGIARISGRPFPENEMNGEGYLMLPAGRLGPAFIVTPNFYVLKEYNTSDVYALFVGHVGDRIDFGVGDFIGQWRPVDTLLRSDVVALQTSLEGMGHDVGGADGLVGFKTRQSIGRWQETEGATPTCFPSKDLLIR